MFTSSRRGNVELCKNLRVEQRQDDDLLQALDVVGRAADTLERGLEVDLHRRDVGAAGSNLLPVPEDGLGHVLLVQVHRSHLRKLDHHSLGLPLDEPLLVAVGVAGAGQAGVALVGRAWTRAAASPETLDQLGDCIVHR